MAEDEDANIISKIEKKRANSEKENLDKVIASSKYAVGGESTEVPAPALDDNSINRTEQTQPKQKKKINK